MLSSFVISCGTHYTGMNAMRFWDNMLRWRCLGRFCLCVVADCISCSSSASTTATLLLPTTTVCIKPRNSTWVGIYFLSPACSKATIMDCSIRSLSMNPRKSSRYMVRSGSWKVHRGVSKSGSLLLPPVLETWERAKDTMVELAWEMPLDRRFSVAVR